MNGGGDVVSAREGMKVECQFVRGSEASVHIHSAYDRGALST